MDQILYSPNRNRPVRKDENMTIFKEKTEILRTFPLKFKGPRSEVRHLQEKHVNTDLTDQSEMSNYENLQVKLNLNIDSSTSRGGRKGIKEIDILRPNPTQIFETSAKNTKNLSDRALWGGGPPFVPEIERHSQEMEGKDGGTIPPPSVYFFGAHEENT